MNAHMTMVAATLVVLGTSASVARTEETSAGDSSEARIESLANAGAETGDLEGRLESITEQLQTLQSDTDKLKKFKFSGYVQARWETGEAKSDTVRVAGSPAVFTPANNERFFIRRGRLKLTYDALPSSQAVVYFDGGTDRTIRLLEAYVTVFDPWTPTQQHQLTVGQFSVPFGYEIERSSSLRELPERSRAENVLFSGERDRGIKLVDQWNPRFETVLGLFNGGGVNHTEFPNTDPTRAKDFLARARFSQGTLDGAVSYYRGKNVTPLTGGDVENDKDRLGFDAQVYYALPTLGGGSLRGEFYSGKEVNPDSVRILTVAPTSTNPNRLLAPNANPDHFGTDFIGWYVMWVQNLGEKLQFAARVDAYDPNVDLDHDQFDRIGIGLNWFLDGFTRFTVAYDAPKTEVSAGAGSFRDPKDNLWTLQVQHRF